MHRAAFGCAALWTNVLDIIYTLMYYTKYINV